MKKICIELFVFTMIAMFITGCATPIPGNPSVIMTPDSDQVESPAAATKASPQKVAEVIKSKVVVAVMDSSSKKDSTTKEIVSKTEGRLIKDGFMVKNAAPFITVQIDSEITLFDKMGNYYVYEGKSDAEIKRSDSKKLGNKQFVLKGKRQLEKSRAKRDVSDKIADDVAKWVSDTCTAKTMGVESIIVTLRISEWESWLGGSEATARKKIKDFTGAVRKLDGILSCQLIGRETSNRQFQLRIVYSSDKFKDGILTGVVSTKKIPGRKFESNPVLWLLKSVFKTSEAAL